jgi:alpha-galactosidase
MPKIVIVGAGSGFGGKLSVDILSRKTLQDSEIGLVDIHPGRLEAVRAYVQNTIDRHGLPARVRASLRRRDLLPGAEFVITSVSVGGGAYYGDPYRLEVEIPRKYGVDQSVADTVGVGAVFRFLRTGPVQQLFFRDMEELCPGALALNHTNPMCMLTWLHSAGTRMRNVGICHGVQGTSHEIARWLGLPAGEISYLCAGINHLAWFLELRRGKEDLYPRLRALMDDPEKIKGEEVRFELLRRFGRFSTESNRHDSEYLPYFRRTPELMAQYRLDSRRIPMTAPKSRAWLHDDGSAPGGPSGELRASNEYTAGIIEAVLTDAPYRFNGNVMNHGLIDNLPEGCCVEVPCLTDAGGVHPCRVGALPPHLAGLCRTNVAQQELAVKAVMEKDREAAFHAVCLDPLASAVLSLPRLRELFDEMWAAEQPWLAHFDPNHRGPLPETCAE